MAKKIIIANWKMNHGFDEADDWIEIVNKNFAELDLSNTDVVLCPPSYIIDYIDGELMEGGFKKLENMIASGQKSANEISDVDLSKIVLNERYIKLGAQDCHYEQKGSFTGDISASMLKKVGCEYVILGHSERRSHHFETNKIISRKILAALNEQITPIICVGEDQEVRDQDKYMEFIYKQIMHSIPQNTKFDKLVIAYEPIWAIGTGTVASLKQIEEIAALIKKIFNRKLSGIANEYHILYGGSVDKLSSKAILSIPGIDGLLVGKASLNGEEFSEIVRNAVNSHQ
jgi:triosephosphate isomerase